MCRWFAYISNDEPCLLEDVLVDPDHALSKQVDDHFLPGLWPWETETKDDDNEEGLKNVYDRNFMNNSDGLGVAWYSTTRSQFTDPTNLVPLPTLYKTLSNPPTDPNFISICATTASNTVFAHIRAASPAMPVNEANCHPFVFGRFTFMHNGGMGDFQKIKKGWVARLSEEAYAKVMGTTDSEHLAGLFFTLLSESSAASGGPSGVDAWAVSHPVSRYVATFNTLIKTVLNLQKQTVPGNTSPSSLNMCMTDGEQLVALRFRSHATQQPPSLYWTKEAGIVLNRKFSNSPNESTTDTNLKPSGEHGNHLIVASEPTTKTEVAKWHVIEKNSFVIRGKNEDVKLEPIGVDWEVELGLKK